MDREVLWVKESLQTAINPAVIGNNDQRYATRLEQFHMLANDRPRIIKVLDDADAVNDIKRSWSECCTKNILAAQVAVDFERSKQLARKRDAILRVINSGYEAAERFRHVRE